MPFSCKITCNAGYVNANFRNLGTQNGNADPTSMSLTRRTITMDEHSFLTTEENAHGLVDETMTPATPVAFTSHTPLPHPAPKIVDAQERTRVPLVASSSIGLSIEERGLEIAQLLGFNQEILAYRLDSSSRRMYTRDVHAYLEFAQTPEQALQPATLVRWMNHLAQVKIPGTQKGYSPNTINRMASAVRRLMKEAGKQDLLDPRVA